jgi:uncharacterized protein YjbI with pentapeptide repeats
MNKAYSFEETYNGIDHSREDFEAKEFELCRFEYCKFAKVNLSECSFIECEFEGCDLSMAKLYGTTIRDSSFKECKMVGLQFDTCNDFGFSPTFESCNLNLSSFFQVKIKNAVFKNCSLNEVDFTEAKLNIALFEECDFANATFSATKLLEADFRSSHNYMIDPESNQITGAKFSLQGLPGLLQKYEIIVD